MKNKEMIVENLAKLRRAIENWELKTEDIIEEIIEIELQIQNYL